MLKVLENLIDFYSFPLAVFREEKEPQPSLSYRSFHIRNFRGLADVRLSFARNDLILLLGLNESGKTSILKAIDAFDFGNDPEIDLKKFFTSIREKKNTGSNVPCSITAEIALDQPLPASLFRKVLKEGGFNNSVRDEVKEFLQRISDRRFVRISRIIPFSDGSPRQSFYQFEEEVPFSSPKLGNILAQEIVRRCPYIIYFEDFQDAIPDRIYTKPQSPHFNRSWREVIDGLFYNTDKDYSIKSFENLYSKDDRRENDARTTLKRVNKTLQNTFTEKWKDLSGVQEISEAELIYDPDKRYFEIKVFEKDGTSFSVHERSKGAVWYLAFLMKTEFRKKKLRDGAGKPIYLIDEPASNLHSTAQQKMIEDFFTLVEDTTLIYTTHSQYLLSASNVRNTYVVKREGGVVSCTKWGEYIKGKNANASYYQPLYDCLHIVPTNLSVPWERAIITEGPTDALVLEMMESVLEENRTHAIYPGSSATNLGTLISLNLGWGASFRVLLDADAAGRSQREKYKSAFGLPDDQFIMLPGKGTKIETMFTADERLAVCDIALTKTGSAVSKDEFLAAVRTIMARPSKYVKRVKGALSQDTVQNFKALLQSLKK